MPINLNTLKEKAIKFEMQRTKELESLEHKERLLYALLESVPLSVVIHKQDKIIDCNKAFTRMRQKSCEDIIGENIFNMIPSEDVEPVKALIKKASDGIRQFYCTTVIGAEGKRTKVSVIAQTVQTNGVACRVVIFVSLANLLSEGYV